MEFRDALKLFRNEVGIAQKDIATALHINISTVARWEQGKTIPNRSTAEFLLDFAKSKSATCECIKNLENTLNIMTPQRLFGSKHSQSADPLSERELSETEEMAERLKSLFENINGGISVVVYQDNGSVRLAYANNRYYQLFGYTKEQLEKEIKDSHDIVFSEDRDKTAAAIKKVKETKQAATFRYRIIKRDGSIAHVHCSSSVTSMVGVNGHVLISILTDITESMQKEQQRNIYGQRLDAIMKNMNSAVTASIIKGDGTVEFLFSNDLYYNMLGCTKEQYQAEIDEPCRFIHPDDLKTVESAVFGLKSVGDAKELQYRVITRDGKIKWLKARISIMTFPDADQPVQLAVYSDVTDIIEAQKKLDFQNNQIKKLLNDTPGGIAIIEVNPSDIKGTLRTTYYNNRFYGYSGYNRDEYQALLSNDQMAFVFQDDIPELLHDIEKICGGEIGIAVDTTVRCRTKGGKFRWLMLTGQLAERRDDICVINISMVDVTQKQEAIDRQRISEEMLRIAAETDQRSMIVYDVKSNVCRAESRTLFSARYGEVFENIPRSLIDMGLTAPDSEDELCSLFARIREGEKKICVSLQLHSGPDKYEWFECNTSTVFDAEGQPDHAVLVFHNITEQRIKEAVFKKWQQSIASRPIESYTLFRCNLSKDASLDQRDGELLKVSFPADAMSFNSRTKLYAEESVYPDDREKYVKLLDSDTLLAMYYRGEHFATLDYRETAVNGEAVWRGLTIEMAEYPNSTDVQAFLMYEDIDEKKKAEIEAIELAKSDPLTGALNRGAFAETVDEIIRKNPNTNSALIMLDMDGFKQINDTFGHAAGDQALQEVVAVLRSYSKSGDLVCRLGGDEFLVWLNNTPYNAVIDKTVQQMCEHIRKAYNREVVLSASAGIALYPQDGQSYNELYPKADKALYKIKREGKDSHAFFSAVNEEQTTEITEALSEVKQSPQFQRGIKRRMLIVDDNESDRITFKGIFKDEYFIEIAKNGTEALVRLQHYRASVSVVLLDLMMPNVDGFTVLKKMQSDVDLRTIPVIIVSGKDDHETLIKAFELGAAEYVVKLVDVDIICTRVKAVVSKAENERLRAQNSYLMLQRDEEVKYHTVLESTGTAVIEYDWRNHVFIYDKEISKHIAGKYDNRGLWQIFLSDMVANSDDVKSMQDMLIKLASNRKESKDSKLVKLKTPNGVKHWYRMNIYKSVDDFGLAEKLIITFNDVHEEILANDKLMFQATRDELTGLYNRTAFLEKATELISAETSGYYVMSCIDVEKFQVINDRYGTEKGDEVLKHISDSISSFVKKHNGLCSRYTADKFAVLYPAKLLGTDELAENHKIASSPDCIPRPLRLRVGRCLVNETALSASAMFDRAAMAETLAKGRYDTYIVDYDESMRDSILKEQQIVGDMVDALQNGEFEPWLQPQYNHATGALIGAEALVRWRKDGKVISPHEFIPVFEKNGFIYEVDQSIWRQACALLRRWLDEGKKPLPISVNISRHDMFQENFIDVITGLMAEYRLPVELLRLEITESAFSADTATITDIAGRLIDAGFTVEIDDFGSGYSSLNTLKDVPASILKLDMRFFEQTGDVKRGGNIVESVVRMAKWLGMAVIAEGVEDKAQADYLKSIGCYYIQGYLYAKPMPADEYEKQLDSNSKEAQLTRLQTMQNLDNNDFWDSHSIDSLIFNSYVGAACILEYTKNKIEMLRATETYITMLGTTSMNVSDALKLNWEDFMDTDNISRFKNAVMESIETKKTVSEELVFTGIPGCPDKVYIIAGLRAIATVGDRILVYCLNNNITDQRNAEQERLESARKLEVVMNNVNGGVSAILIDDNGTSEVVFNNSKYYELYGYTREQAQASKLDIMSLILPEDIDSVMEKIKKLKQDRIPIIIDYSIKKRDGRRALLRANTSVMSFPGYDDNVIVSVIADITEKRSLEDQLRAIVDNIYGAVSATYIIDGQPQFIVVNDQFFRILGYATREEYEAENPDKYTGLHPDDRDRIIRQFESSDGGKTQYTMDYRIVRKDGTIRYIRNNISVIDMFGIDSPVQLSVANDITDQKEAEIKRDNISAQMQVIMANIQGGVTALLYRDENTIEFVYANDGYYELYGYTREQIAAEVPNIFDLILPEDRKKTIETVTRIQKSRNSETYTYRCHKRDGSIIWIKCTSSVISIDGIGDNVLLGVLFDITKEYEAELGKAIAIDRLKTVMDAMNSGISAVAIKEGEAKFLFANNRYYEMHGIPNDENNFSGLQVIYRLVHSDDRDRIRSVVLKAKNIGETITDEYRVIRPDGKICWFRAVIKVIKMMGVDVPVQVTIFTDISSEKKANDQIRFLNESAGEILAQPESEKAINETLRKLLDYFVSERTYIFELDDETKTSDNTYEICAPGVISEIERLQNIPYDTQQHWFDAFDKTGFIVISDVASITDKNEIAMRELLLMQNIHSIIVAPLRRDNKLIGYIGIDNPTKALDQVSQLIALSDYIAVLLTRRDLMKSIEYERKTIQQLMDDTPGGFLRLRILPDNTPVIVSLNSGFCQMLGMTYDEVMAEYGNDAHKCMVEEDIATVKGVAAKSLVGNGVYTYKCRLKKKDGTIIFVQVFGRFVKDENGELFRNSYFTDITEKLAVEENQRVLLDNLPFGAAMYIFDGTDLIVNHINRQYWKLVGREPTEYDNTSVIDNIHPDDKIITVQELQAAIRQGRSAAVDMRILNGAGGYSPFHVTASIVPLNNGKHQLFVAYLPISDEALSLQEILPIAMSTMVSSSQDMSYVKDKNLKYICVSPSVAEMAGAVSPRDLVGKSAEEVFGKEFADKFNSDDRHVIETGETSIHLLEHIPTTDGSVRLVRTSKYPILNAAGHAIGLYCVSQDITAQKENESQLQLLTDSIPGGIATFRCTSDNLETVYFNDGVCELAGYSREEYDEHLVSLLDLIFDEDRPVIREQITLLQNGEKNLNFTTRIHTKSGGYKWINNVAAVTDIIGDVFIINAVLTDVTKQQEERESLRLAEEEYRIATEHSARTICRYSIAEKSLKIAHEAATRLALPSVIQGVPYEQIKNGSISSDTADNYVAFYEKIMQGEKVSACVFCIKLKNRWRWLSARSTSIFDLSGKPVSAIVSFSDITEEQEKELIYKKWEQSLTERKSKQFTLYRCNLNKDASYDTKEGTLFGFTVENQQEKHFNECTAEFCSRYVVDDDKSKYMEFLDSNRMLAKYYHGIHSGELIFRAVLGEDDIRWIRLSLDLLEYPDSTDVEAYLMYEDINDSVLEELQIKKMAETDALTGLKNRKFFIERVNTLIGQKGKLSHRALFLLDIDYFKHINDTFGHGVGDESIVKMASVILSVFKEDGIVCRLGGDEFLVYLPDMSNRDSVAAKARELCEAAHIIIKNDVRISISVGVAVITDEDKGENFDSLYHKADKALYYVKGHGKDNFAFYETDMEKDDNEVTSDEENVSLMTLADGENTMLIVDDSAINRLVTAGIFKKYFNIVEAENGQVALEYLRKHSNEVAIVLLDIMMPVMDGYQLLAVIKADPVLREVPVIAISGEDDRKASLRAIKAGASEYIVKPVDAELLRLRVSSVLSKSENERLRKQNRDYAVDSQELHSYRSLIDSNATVLIEYNTKTGAFKYAPKTSDYLNGTFDERPIWQILAEDRIASDTDVEAIRKMIIETDKPCKAMFDLVTPDGTAHPFLMKVILRDTTENDDIILITLTDRK